MMVMIERAKKMGFGMWICVALTVVVVVAIAAGAAGSWLLLPLVACTAMMGMMVWMMVGGMGHGRDQR
jgi:hypothetical protein